MTVALWRAEAMTIMINVVGLDCSLIILDRWILFRGDDKISVHK
jgi:hypothetical protein